jgi:hypothetical protein
MFYAVVAAAIAYPTGGTYTYQVQTPDAAFMSTIVIAPDADGVRTHETFGAPTPIAETDQQFDSDLAQRSFVAAQHGKTLTIEVSPTAAHYSIDGHSVNATLDHPVCTLIDDNVLTSVVMLPAVVQATHATQCTYVLSTAPRTIVADLSTTPPATHPPQAAASDLAVTAQIGAITEIVWYDPQTLIPDYIDFGHGQSATLTNRSPSAVVPTPMPLRADAARAN